MAEMAADPVIRAECAAIAEEFAPAEMDGLNDGYSAQQLTVAT